MNVQVVRGEVRFVVLLAERDDFGPTFLARQRFGVARIDCQSIRELALNYTAEVKVSAAGIGFTGCTGS